MRLDHLALSILSGCAFTPVYTATGTVAHVEPTTRTGAPLTHRVEVTGESSAITTATTDGDDSSVLVSRWHAGGEVRIRAAADVDLDVIGGVSSSSGPLTRTSSFPSAPVFNPWEVGVGAQVTEIVAEHVSLAFAPRALVMAGAWHTALGTAGSDATVILSAAGIVRWQVAPLLALIGSLTLVNQPTTGPIDDPCSVPFAENCADHPVPPPTHAHVEFGNYYAVPTLGAELRVGRATFAVLVYQPESLPVHGSVAYGPAFLTTASLGLP